MFLLICNILPNRVGADVCCNLLSLFGLQNPVFSRRHYNNFNDFFSKEYIHILVLIFKAVALDLECFIPGHLAIRG